MKIRRYRGRKKIVELLFPEKCKLQNEGCRLFIAENSECCIASSAILIMEIVLDFIGKWDVCMMVTEIN